ncbi:serpentine type 7TM GPCR chemoreceptor srt domain-containing protein [Ditylenchus destructor]|nr:serpentine type 7TM GPCR chemoreceptor srt domain-containing protein [Ditylenchus destructor]
MEMFIFRPEEYNRLYNCAAINVDDVPLERRIWITVSLAEVSLTINRCLAILAPNLEKRFFGGWRVSVWIAASLIYGSLWCIYVKPVLFNGIHFTWFFNPFIGYTEDVTEAVILCVE